jgi:polyhydroxybutyrate depolymerase
VTRAVLLLLLVVVSALAGCGGERGKDEGGRGCGSSAAETVKPGVDRVELRSGGQSRWYRREVPLAYDGERPAPVVVDLHGYGEGAEGHARSSGLGTFGAVEGFVTVTPQGRGAPAAWDASPGSPDLRFLEDVLDQVERSLCVDTDRVFVAGSSNGAMMAVTLACEAPDRIAAVAAIAGVEVVDGCHPDRPVPIVAFHGTHDPTIRYGGGLDAGVAALRLPGSSGTIGDIRPRADLSIPGVMAWWARQAGCGTSPSPQQVAADTVLLRFPCPGRAAVELYRIDGGGHTWPGRDIRGTGPTLVRPGPQSPLVANDLIWRFFEAHPLDP